MPEHPDREVPGTRAARLPGGRSLTVRPVRPDDLEGVAELFASLPTKDLYLRFFSAYCPDREFVERVVHLDGERGLALVAVVDDKIVAEADFHVQDGRDPELSIVVAQDHRGWLGPYLLDALLEAAAARGFQNLEAEVLLANTSMLALLRARGYAVVDHPDAGTAHVLVGTTGPTPTWAGRHDRPRLLVEVPGGFWRHASEARALGLDVLVCPGPRPGHERRCPAVSGAPCPLAAGADAIVMGLPPSDPSTATIAASHRGLARVRRCSPADGDDVEAFLRSLAPETAPPADV